MEAVEGWFRSVLGVDWYELNVNRGMGTPFVHVDMDFSAMLTPHNTLDIKVLVERCGRCSITFRVIAEREDGVESFAGRYACCLVSRPGNKPIVIPGEMRRKIEEYQQETSS